jgi:hypothetical protein
MMAMGVRRSKKEEGRRKKKEEKGRGRRNQDNCSRCR